MDKRSAWSELAGARAAKTAAAALFACALILGSALAQDAPKASLAATDTPKAQSAPTPPQQPGFFAAIGRWFDQTTSTINQGARSMRERFQNLGHEAGVAAQSTVDNAKDAADAMGRLPNARMMGGHEKCETAPNGAPDCIAAAYAICKAKGFNTGKSVDMTTAEVCPAQVYLAGRNSGPGCHTETFVSRALCQ
jgi:hypothetical protein